MSLFRQLWLAILGLTVFVFLGSFLLSAYSALSHGQLPKPMVTPR